MRTHPSRRAKFRSSVPLTGALLTGLLVAGPVGTSNAADAVDDAPLLWLEGELTDNGGTMPSSFDPASTDYGLTLDAVLALTLGGRGSGAPAIAAIAAVEADINNYIASEAFDPDAAYAGAIGKTLTTASIRGEDVNDFGGVDLEAKSRDAMQTNGLQQGRFSDVSAFGDFSNGFGQALNISGLSFTLDGAPDDAVDFLIDQQCSNGGFRLSYGGTTPTRGCEVDADADTDATSLALQALLAVDPEPDTRAAIADAITFLLELQTDDGGFGANANSTGLASQALLAAGQTAAALDARDSVMGLQLAATDVSTEVGAIAFNQAAFDAAVATGVAEEQRDQFRRATSQGVLAYALASFGDIADYVAVTPDRVLDTRSSAPLNAGDEANVLIAGVGDVPVTAGAVVLNVTAVRASEAGFLTVWDCSSPRPTTSSVNFSGPQASPNSVITGVSENGTVCYYSDQNVDVIIDVNGYLPAGSNFTAFTPERLVDTRESSPIPADGVFEVQVAGQVDASLTPGANAVLNVTAVRGAGAGFLTVWDCSDEIPETSSVNFAGPAASPNAVISRLSDTGTVCVYSNQDVDVIVDVSGAFLEGSDYVAITPGRLIDSRSDAITPAGLFSIPVVGSFEIPASATAVALNVTAVRGAGIGFVSVWDCSDPQPVTSSVNFSGPEATPNSVIAKLSDDGRVCLSTSESVDLVVDVGGYFG